MVLKLRNIAIILVSAIIALSACKSTKEIDTRNVEEVYRKALELFKNEDYIESKNLFDVIRLQFPASQYADDAQYYLAEIAFARDEFVLAAYSYNALRKYYPGSEYTKIALFKSGLSSYNTTLPYDRDQKDTKAAIQTFQEYQYLYPGDSLYNKASEYINELRERLAQREFSTAELYRKLTSPRSALIYFDNVIRDYNDTKFLELAYYGKIQVLIEMKRKDEALGSIDVYYRLFPNGKYLLEVKALESELKKSN